MKFYLVYKNNGLYDPVLDNYEPIYEDIDQIERADIDQPSQPTEVHDPFKIQQFLDPNQDIFPQKDLIETPKLSESRSLTASPFVLPTKPYRPFSTEPLPEIPPLEKPIILNPNYRDEFGKILDEFDDLKGKYESKFKLPISEQYDPNWDKKETDRSEKNTKGVEVKLTEIKTKFEESVNKTEVQEIVSEKKELMVQEDVTFMKKIKQDIDLDKIEQTATCIVDESIERAKCVAEEIKKEIDVEISETVKDSKISTEIKSETLETSKQVSMGKIEKQSDHEDLGIVKRETNVIDKSKETSEIFDIAQDRTEVKVAKKVENFEAINVEDCVSDERKKLIHKEVEEVIESGTVRRKSKMFDNEEKSLDTKVKSEVKVDENIESGNVSRKSVMFDNEETTHDVKVKSDVKTQIRQTKSDIKNENVKTDSSNVEHKTFENKESVDKTTNVNAEQRAYTIGLKTIPNIRGSVHSSYHYNLLLQTFFLHLTDVMVALSRFILSEPVFNKLDEKRESVATHQMSSSAFETKTESVSKKTDNLINLSESKSAESSIQTEKINKAVQEKSEVAKQLKDIEQTVVKSDIKDNNVEIKTHKKAVSGSEMAQLTEKKAEELTVKMDAVISEFENKTGIEETNEHRRRSRSRSQVVEEVMKESDPLDWLSKVDSQKTQDITESKTSSSESHSVIESIAMKKEISNVVLSAAEKKIESRHGSRARSTTPNKQMYVAIVESHVYTNKDTVLLDQTDISETSSVVEETLATESLETAATENVAKETSEVIKETVTMSKDNRQDIKQIDESIVKVNESKQQSRKIEEVIQKSNEVGTGHIQIETFQNDVKTQHATVLQVNESKVEVQENTQLEKRTEEAILTSDKIIAEQIKVETMQSEIKTQDVVVQKEVEPINELYESKEDREISVKKENFEVAQKETVEIQELDVSADIKVEKSDIKPTKPQLESVALKIVKEEVIEVQPSPEILEKEETKVLKIEKSVDMSKGNIVESESTFVDISSSSSLDSIDLKCKTAVQESTFTAKSSVKQSDFSLMATSISESVQESSFVATSNESNAHKLTLNTDLAKKMVLEQQSSVSSDENTNICTPTPSTVPPTPVTDEYVFKLQIPLPKTSGNVIPLDLTPEEEEDLHIVKKKLVPHIETTLESPVIYDPPLPSPPGTKVGSPVYTKPGLRGGNLNSLRKEEILEIERKSTLLASAIDQTIKSIEEYKEQVGMETKKDVEESSVTFCSKSENYSKDESSISTVSKTEVKSKIEDEWSKVDKQVEDSNRTLTELSKVSHEDDKVESKHILVNGVADSVAKNLNEIENNMTEMTEEVVPEKVINGIVNGDSETLKEEDFCKPVESRICGEEAISYAKLSKRNSVVDNCLTNGVNETRNVFTDVGIFVKEEQVESVEDKEDPMKGFRPVVFNPEPMNPRPTAVYIDLPAQETGRPYTTPTGELLGTHQGIVDGLEEAVVDEEVAKELGKPGMTEEKIAELISGESEMLREAHVMGLTRVLTSHMSRADDNTSVDFNKIKPIVESLKDSEVLKALNEEILKKTKEEKKKNEKKWTTFLQKPKRAVPKAKFGYHGYVDQEELVIEAPYKVKIVKQPKPKVAPDYKPETFDTGPLPWEERALHEPPPPPVEAEDPILVPEEVPEFLEAVDPLPESEVPDLEETGIPLPPPKSEEEVAPTAPPPEPVEEIPEEPQQETEQQEPEPIEEKEMENRLAEQLVSSVQNMVDPTAPLEQQLSQMRAQLAALAQLPAVIQQTLQLVSTQLSMISQQESVSIQASQQSQQSIEDQTVENEENQEPTISEETGEDEKQNVEIEDVTNEQTVEDNVATPSLTQEEMEKLRKEEEEMLEEQRRIEKQKKEMMERMRQDQESRQVKQRPTPRVGKPKPVFGNGDQERPLVLPGGRKWRGPKDAFNDQFIAETLSAQAEIIQGKAKGINFLKYEKPPVSLDHLQHSDVYKLVHNMEGPLRRVDMLTPVVAEADYREKCRSISPCVGRVHEQHQDFPQQVQP